MPADAPAALRDLEKIGARPRPGAYETYWHFVNERLKIYMGRYRGDPAPWSDDPILQTFKFTNVFRASDRVTQYLIKDICYSGEVGPDLAFQIAAFRTFSRIETWEHLKEVLGGPPRISNLEDGSLEDALTAMRDRGEKLYTGAFILCANDAYGRRIKHLNHLELFRAMFLTGDLYRRVVEAGSLGEVYDALHVYPLMGDFMSYQTAIDLNYSELIDFSENEFTKAGPGAVRGINKVFELERKASPEAVINWIVENQEAEMKRLGHDFDGLHGRPLQAIDAQNCFCESDKYLRVSMPELQSARKKIKAKFAVNTTRIPYFYPPKWGLDY